MGERPKETLFYAAKYSQVKFQHTITGFVAILKMIHSQFKHSIFAINLLTRQILVKEASLISKNNKG